MARLCKDAAGLLVTVAEWQPAGRHGTGRQACRPLVGCPAVTQRSVVRCRVANPLKEALTALADALAKRPAEEILFDWFRSGRLVGELSVLIKRRHPEMQAEIDRVYQEHLAKLGKRRRDPATQDD